MVDYRLVKKFEDMFSSFHIIHECDRQADGRTYRHRAIAQVARRCLQCDAEQKGEHLVT